MIMPQLCSNWVCRETITIKHFGTDMITVFFTASCSWRYYLYSYISAVFRFYIASIRATGENTVESVSCKNMINKAHCYY